MSTFAMMQVKKSGFCAKCAEWGFTDRFGDLGDRVRADLWVRYDYYKLGLRDLIMSLGATGVGLRG